MIKLRINKTYSYPSGLTFKEGDIYWGYYGYIEPSLINIDLCSNRSIIFKEGFGNGLSIPNQFIEKA